MKGKISPVLLALAVFVLLSTAASAAVNWNISSTSPTVGDALKITGTASPGENIKAEIFYNKALPVSGGKYRFLLENIKIPQSNNNQFTVRVDGVQSMHLGAKRIIWITLNPKATGGVATVSQANVPAATYQVLIAGDALKGRSSVNLKATASQTLKASSKGTFEYTYNTSTLPAGTYTIKIGNVVKTVELKLRK